MVSAAWYVDSCSLLNMYNNLVLMIIFFPHQLPLVYVNNLSVNFLRENELENRQFPSGKNVTLRMEAIQKGWGQVKFVR